MTLITDGLLIAGTAFAGTYCHVLARRVRALKDLDSGLGGAITRMTVALEEARRTLEEAKATNRESNKELKALLARSEGAAGQLRMLLAATRDLPEPAKRSSGSKQPANQGWEDALREEQREAAESAQPAAPRPGRAPAGPLIADRGPAPALRGAEADLDLPVRPLRMPRPKVSLRADIAPAPKNEEDLLEALASFASTGKA